MSYSILHIQKFKRAAVTGIQIHNEREKESRTNPDIEKDKTHLNYELHKESDQPYRSQIKNRTDQLNLKRAIRKDATVCVGFLTTSDKSFFDGLSPGQVEFFFKESYEFLKNRYGQENIISSKVHMDERTPHMHTYIVPVTEDGRLSAKDLFSPSKLRTLQSDFNAFLREKGFDLERGKMDSNKKHMDVQKYKLETDYANRKINTIKKVKDGLERNLELIKEEASLYSQIVESSLEIQDISIKNLPGNYGLVEKEALKSIKNVQANYFWINKELGDRRAALDGKEVEYASIRHNFNMQAKINNDLESQIKQLKEENVKLNQENLNLAIEKEELMEYAQDKFDKLINDYDINIRSIKNTYRFTFKELIKEQLPSDQADRIISIFESNEFKNIQKEKFKEFKENDLKQYDCQETDLER